MRKLLVMMMRSELGGEGEDEGFIVSLFLCLFFFP